VFVIIAVIIVAIISIFLIFRNSNGNTNSSNVLPEVIPIYTFVQSCIRDTGKEALYHIGQTGGYYITNFSTPSNVSYYFYNGKDYMPSKNTIENELSKYLNNRLVFCINNFTNFNNSIILQKNISSKARIEDTRVVFDVEYPLTIIKNSNTYTLSNFNGVEIPVRLGIIYNSISELMKNQTENPKSICLSCAYDIASKNDLYIDIYDYDEETSIFMIQDRNLTINGDVYLYLFANKYNVK